MGSPDLVRLIPDFQHQENQNPTQSQDPFHHHSLFFRKRKHTRGSGSCHQYTQGSWHYFDNARCHTNEITIDLMRHRKAMVNGTMDVLFCTLFQHFKDRGFDGFNLGLSALSGVGDSPASTRLEKGVHYLYQHLNQFYNFKGLHAYKAKFKPHWEPRFFVFPTYAALPGLVVALVRADSGDRLLDYFKPGS
jgi:hypothetical protein